MRNNNNNDDGASYQSSHDNNTDNYLSRINDTNSSLHLIDHGSVLYLILLQIRLYDQQDALLLLENNTSECDLHDNNNTDVTSVSTMKMISYKSSEIYTYISNTILGTLLCIIHHGGE